MGRTITGDFDNRRDAEMTVERLVQERGIERTDVFLAAAGADNTAGEAPSGADVESGHSDTTVVAQPALGGPVTVSVDIADEADAPKVEAALGEFGAKNLRRH